MTAHDRKQPGMGARPLNKGGELCLCVLLSRTAPSEKFVRDNGIKENKLKRSKKGQEVEDREEGAR